MLRSDLFDKHLSLVKYIWLLALLCSVPVLQAQEAAEARLSLRMDSAELETGQRYPVRIEIESPSDLWLINLEISYDPAQIYVIGTQAGSPFTPGPLFISKQNINFRNDVGDGLLSFTHSLLGQVMPVSEDGLLATFEIVPLLPGPEQLSFVRAELLRSIVVYDEAGQPLDASTEGIPFVPIMIDLSISGDPASPPAEATATPAFTPTPDPALLADFTPEPTETPLLNITELPITASPAAPPETISAPESPTNLLGVGLAIGLIVLALLGLLFLWRLRR